MSKNAEYKVYCFHNKILWKRWLSVFSKRQIKLTFQTLIPFLLNVVLKLTKDKWWTTTFHLKGVDQMTIQEEWYNLIGSKDYFRINPDHICKKHHTSKKHFFSIKMSTKILALNDIIKIIKYFSMNSIPIIFISHFIFIFVFLSFASMTSAKAAKSFFQDWHVLTFHWLRMLIKFTNICPMNLYSFCPTTK